MFVNPFQKNSWYIWKYIFILIDFLYWESAVAHLESQVLIIGVDGPVPRFQFHKKGICSEFYHNFY